MEKGKEHANFITPIVSNSSINVLQEVANPPTMREATNLIVVEEINDKSDSNSFFGNTNQIYNDDGHYQLKSQS